MGAAHFVFETVECSCDVRVRLQIDPLSDVFLVGDLPNHELLSEVLVVNDKCRVAENVFNLCKNNKFRNEYEKRKASGIRNLFQI